MEVVEVRCSSWWAALTLDLSGLDVMADLDPGLRAWDPRDDR
ncbi:MAG TPA: hypothetical protein VM784_01675 [Actinomycetota bacterium]|nr:hypothetical protein [Actinomycetota bacterium]